MLIINAVAEQFCTLLDEFICSEDPRYLKMHDDDRLNIVAHMAAKRFPEYVLVTEHHLPTGQAACVVPQAKLFEVIGHRRDDLPVRSVQFRTRDPLKNIAPSLIAELERAVEQISPENVSQLLPIFTTALAPICSSESIITGWDKYGMMVVVSSTPKPRKYNGRVEHRTGIGQHRSYYMEFRYGSELALCSFQFDKIVTSMETEKKTKHQQQTNQRKKQKARRGK